jgi:DNA-binding MarR family transcriptional regulator
VRKPIQPTHLEELAQALSRAERCVSRRLARALEPEACTVEQWRILLLLGDGRGHRMSELAEFALLPAPTLTRLVDRMATDGLLYRRIDERDRRRVLVHLTRRGRALRRSAGERVEREQEALLAGADAKDVQRLRALLDELAERVS